VCDAETTPAKLNHSRDARHNCDCSAAACVGSTAQLRVPSSYKSTAGELDGANKKAASKRGFAATVTRR
jgi:hypothetical protein